MFKELINIAQTFLRADGALKASPAWARYCAIGNYFQELQDAMDEKGPWPEGPEPRRLTDAELLELDRLQAARWAALSRWNDIVWKGQRGALDIDTRAFIVRESTRPGALGEMFSELVDQLRLAR